MKSIVIAFLLVTITHVTHCADFFGNFIATGNCQYNYLGPTLNAIGTTSLDGKSATIDTFPQAITLQGSLTINPSTTSGGVAVDITSYNFTGAPLVLVTGTNNPNLGYVNFYVTNTSASSITINAQVGTAPGIATSVNFSLLIIGF